jgi:hypothetical protein
MIESGKMTITFPTLNNLGNGRREVTLSQVWEIK